MSRAARIALWVSASAIVAALTTLNLMAFEYGEDYPLLLAINWVVDFIVLGIAIATAILYWVRAEAERTRTRAALDETQARLAAMVDSAMDAILTVDENQRIVLFNRAAETVFRCRRQDALGSPLERFIPARFRAAHRAHIERFGRTGVTSRRMGDITVLWGLRADGEEFPIEASISQAREGDSKYFTVILRDITHRKEYEDQLKKQQHELRELSARVLEAREEEKANIARELHDELGQALTALKMDVSWVREHLPAGDGELAGRTTQMNVLLDRTVNSVRRISADLRPLMLDDLGLHDAVSWLVDDFSERSSIECRLDLPGDGALADVDRSVAIALYRVLQESLTNIARHAQAKRAWVVLGAGGSTLQLEVEDDGRGIADEDLARPRSLGLKGIRERVRYLGGVVEIGRAPRGGTRVFVRIPRMPVPGEAA